MKRGNISKEIEIVKRLNKSRLKNYNHDLKKQKSLDRFHNQIETTEARVSALEDWSIETVTAEEQRRKYWKINEKSAWYFSDIWPNISMIGYPSGEVINICEDIIVETFWNLEKDTYI